MNKFYLSVNLIFLSFCALITNAINYSSAKVKKVVAQTVVSSNIVSEAANQVSQGSSDLSGRV
jgi:hypothetical protein